MTILTLLCLLVISNIPDIGKTEINDILDELDMTIARRDRFEKAKERRLNEQKVRLTGGG